MVKFEVVCFRFVGLGFVEVESVRLESVVLMAGGTRSIGSRASQLKSIGVGSVGLILSRASIKGISRDSIGAP